MRQNQIPLKICFFSHSVELTGAERSLLELVTELIGDHGAKCFVVLPAHGPLEIKLNNVGASTITAEYGWWCDINRAPDDQITRALANGIKNLSTIIDYINEINPDIIVTNTMVIPWGAVIASFINKPHVWFIHEFGQLDHRLIFYLPFHQTLEIIRNSSNLILVNSNAVKTMLFGSNENSKILTFNHYIELPNTHKLEDENRYFTKLQALKLIIAGTISESKGQKDAVLAAKKLIEKGENIDLIVMGQGSSTYSEQLKQVVKNTKANKNVTFLDFQANPYPIIQQADIVLVCSKNEAFGRVTLEGMLMKKPIIGTNSGGTSELIKDGYNGFLYTPGDYDQLAEKITYFIEHPAAICEMGEKGYAFASNNYTKEQYGGRIYKLLLQLQGQNNPLQNSLTNIAIKIFFSVFPHHTGQAKNLQNELNTIKPNMTWRIATRINILINKTLPQGSKRRRLAKRINKIIKI
jgi:glycosyltransferase involved in cell wall biosynthesis